MTALDFPTAPSNGDTYQNYVYDSTAGVWKRLAAGLDLNDITDVTLTSPTDGQALVYDNATSNWVNGEGSTVPVLISETAPASPEVGELWLNSTEAKMYVYYDDGSSAQWVAAVGGTVPSQGKILQVLSAHKSDTFATASTSFVDVPDLSVTITPASSSNKVLVRANVPVGQSSGGDVDLVVLRDSTAINNHDSKTSYVSLKPAQNTTQTNYFVPHGGQYFEFLDSPATTSAISYKVQIKVNSDTGYVNRSRDSANYFAVASITIMEVAG